MSTSFWSGFLNLTDFKGDSANVQTVFKKKINDKMKSTSNYKYQVSVMMFTRVIP